MTEYHRSCWLRVVLAAMDWQRPARVELGEWMVERGRHEGDDFLIGAGEAIRDYEGRRRFLPQRPEHRA